MSQTCRAPARCTLLKTARRSTGVMRRGTPQQGPRLQPPAGRLRLAEKITQHRFAELKIGDHAVAQRPDDRDRFRRAAFHLPGEVSDGAASGKDSAGAVLDGHHGRFVQEDPFAGRADPRIGRPQVDGQVAAKVLKKMSEHPCPES